MCCRPFACVALSLLVHVAASDSVVRAADKPGNQKEETAGLSQPGSPEELAARFGKLLLTSTRSDLDRLASISDCTAAMAAGWERVRRTMPETQQKAVVTPDSLALLVFWD